MWAWNRWINALASYRKMNYADFVHILKESLTVNPEQGIAALVSASDRQRNVLFLHDSQLVDDAVVDDDALGSLTLRLQRARTV